MSVFRYRYEEDIKQISPGRTNHNIPLVILAGIASKLNKSWLHFFKFIPSPSCQPLQHTHVQYSRLDSRSRTK